VSAHRAGFVALIGRPNAGKSTLLNRLVGEKLSIVSPRPQTTRNRITGIKNRGDAQVIFVDTPGLHVGRGQLGEFMQKTAERAAAEVDLVCLVVDVTAPEGADDVVLAPLRAFGGPVFCVLNKVDRVKPKGRLLPLLERWRAAHPFQELLPLIEARLSNGVWPKPDPGAGMPASHPAFVTPPHELSFHCPHL